MLIILIALCSLIFCLSFLVQPSNVFMSGFIGGFFIILITLIILFLIFLLVYKIIQLLEILNKDPNPSPKIDYRYISNFFKGINYRDSGLEFCEFIAMSLLCLSIFCPFFVIGYQIFLYLKNGFWQSLSIIDVLSYFNIPWAVWPNDWIGLWKVLNFINISIPVSFIFLILACIAGFIMALLDKR